MTKRTESTASKPQSLRVLMVEDSEDDVLLIIRELKKGGYNPVYEWVETATAMKKALKEKQWDIILCDYKLPKFNAPSAIALLKEANIDIPLIIVSGTIGEETAVECMRLGAHDYIMKNNLSRLCQAITRELEGADSRSRRKQAEKSLRESEERFRSLFENSLMGISAATPNGHLIHANPAYALMYGYDNPVQMIAAITDIGHQLYANPEERKEVLRLLSKKGFMEPREVEVIKRDGTRFSVLVSAREIRDAGGKLLYYQAAHLDITDRKKLEEILVKEREDLKLIIDASPIRVFFKDKEGKFIRVNRIYAKTLNMPEENIIGKTVFDLYSPQIAQSMTGDDQEVFQSRRPKLNIIEQYESASGIRWVQTDKIPIFDKDGVPVGLIGFAQDITDREKLQEILVKEREDLKLIIDASPIIVFYKDKEGRFIRVNKIFADALNIREESFVGKTVFDFYSPQIAQNMTDDDQEVLQSRRPKLNIIEQYESASGLRWVQTDKIPICDKDGIPLALIGFAQDITDRKQTERALRESEENFHISLDNSPLGVRIATAEGETLYANQAVLDMFGYTSIDELRKTPLKDRYTPESYADFQIRKKKRGRGEFAPSEYEISIVRKNGEIRHLRVFRKEVIWNGAKQFQIIYQDITERKQAEETLRESEEKYRNILESIEDGYYEVDLAGNLTFFNDSLCRINGYPREELMGMNNRQYTDEYNAKQIFQAFNEVYRTEKPATGYEYEVIRKDGAKAYIAASISLRKDAAGKKIGFRGIIHDITEAKRTEEALKKSEEKYRLTFASTSDIIFTVDPELKVSNITPSVEKVLGYSPEELINKHFSDLNLMTPESLERAIFNVQQVFSGLDVPNAIYEFITKDGVKGIGEVTGSPIIQENKIIGVTCVARDITERKLAETALTKSEEKYRSLVENAQEGIYQSAVGYLTLNPALAHMLGYDSPEEVMATVTDIARQLYVNPDDRKKLLEIVNEKGSITNFETEYYKKDGSRIWVSINMHAVRDDQGHILYYQGINQDITEKKKIEAERQENIARLRKSLGATINAMAVTVETRDPYTAGHQRRVADLARAIATEMNLTGDQIDGVRMASMIHDIGKISIPSEILTKPTKLTNLEFNLIKTHPASGYNILKDIEFPWPIAQIVLEHHERIDGSGYPNGLKGEQILLESKIIAIADVVEAISSHRPYRAAFGIDAALDEITKNRGILFDPDLVDACLRLFREKNYNLAA
ncbi:MAG: PAS domain S-box protein [Smithellaceae bacterium]